MTLVARVLNWKGRYRMAGKFSGNLIWRIGLQFHLAVLFLRVMMSYVIAMWHVHVRNPNAPPSSNIRSRGNMEAELCIESWTKALRNVWLPLQVHVQRRTFWRILLYLPHPEVFSSCARFTSAFIFSTCLSEREGTFVGYVRRSLVEYMYNTIFKASFTLVSDTSHEKFLDPTHQVTSWNIGGY